jgi:beta-fructofuranosidase
VTGFRDPCPWHEDDGWYLGVGSGERGKGGCVLLYRSEDLRHWEYLHKLAEGKWGGSQAANPVDSGEMWECPDFFALAGETGKHEGHVLLYSTQGKSLWTAGQYDRGTHTFKADDEGRPLDYGAYYAPKSFLAPDDRRILWGWIQETRPQAAYSAAGWAGVMSLPRVLTLDASGRLAMMPAKEIESLRGARETARVGAHTPYRLKLPHLRRELLVQGSAPHSTLTIRLAVQGTTVWKLEFNGSSGVVRCGDIQFTAAQFAHHPPELRIFLDGSVIEAFVNTTDALTSRVYTLHAETTELMVEIDGPGTAALQTWPLRAISPDRLTT